MLTHHHGLRHRFTQELYEKITGFEPPCRGGLSRSQLSPEQKEIDQRAREAVIAQMGHEKIWQATVYLGH